MKTVDDTIQFNLDFARSIFEQSGDFRPMFIIHNEDSFIPVSVDFGDDREKWAMLNLVRLLLVRYKGHSYSIIHEAWMAKAKSRDEIKGQVKDHPDKTEALIVSYVGYDRKEMVSLEIKRDGDKVTLGEPEWFKDGSVEGRFFELLPPKEIHEKQFSEDEIKKIDLVIGLHSQLCGITAIEIRKKGDESGQTTTTKR